ncbi:MAG: hypothetical protein ACT4P6_12075 [Gemmatimonadaceae bacterium]
MLDPLSLALVPAIVGAVTVMATLPLAAAGRFLLRRARRGNREGRCGACGSYLPFTSDPNQLFTFAGTFLCRRCAQRGRRFLRIAAITTPPVLLTFAAFTIVAILNSGMPLSWWVGSRLIFALLPSVGVGITLGATIRALKRANQDPAVPAYDSVTQALDVERARRETWALPRA